MTRIAYFGPESTFTEAALLRMAANGMVPSCRHSPARGRYPHPLAGENPSAAVTPVPAESTAAALAAARYGLNALAFDVVDEPDARTRFVLAGPPGPPPPRTGADRTSVVLRIDNATEALVSALTELAIRGIDLTRIESRPTRTELDTCIFFLDCVGHIEDAAVAEALMALHRRCADVRYLGSWPTDR